MGPVLDIPSFIAVPRALLIQEMDIIRKTSMKHPTLPPGISKSECGTLSEKPKHSTTSETCDRVHREGFCRRATMKGAAIGRL